MSAPILQLARGLQLDPDYVGGGTFAWLAKKGWGKTYAMRVMAEEFAAAGVPFVILDPMDAFWGLRAGKNGGASGGIEISIFGGPHGDVPLEPTAGALMADLVVDEQLSMVLSMAHFGTRAAERRFAMDFLDRLYRRNSELVHVVIDEADLFAPQKPQAGDQPLLGVTENIVRRGRNKGIGISLATQRPAVLNKDVLTQVDGIVVGRMLGPNDRNSIDEWVGAHGDHGVGKKIKDELPALATGECWVWIPELEVLRKVRIRKARTFDSSPTRKRAASAPRRLTLADVDLHAIAGKVADTVERAKAEDPKELRKRIRELEAELAKRPEAEPEAVEVKVAVLDDDSHADVILAVDDLRELIRPFPEAVKKLVEVSTAIGQQLDRAEQLVDGDRPSPAPPRATPLPSASPPPLPPSGGGADGEVKLKAGARRMLGALAQLYPAPLTRSQVALLADVSPRSGTFSDYLSALRRAGLIDELADKRLHLTQAGQGHTADLLGSGPPSPEALADMWGRKLKAGARRMLAALMAHREGLTREILAERAEVSARSGTFSDYLSALRRNGLVEERGGLLYPGEALYLGQSR